MIAGGAAGALASACTTPLDVVKTLLNTQETGVGATHGMKAAITQVISSFRINFGKIHALNNACAFSLCANRFMRWPVHWVSSKA